MTRKLIAAPMLTVGLTLTAHGPVSACNKPAPPAITEINGPAQVTRKAVRVRVRLRPAVRVSMLPTPEPSARL